jgi:hypothetical protein
MTHRFGRAAVAGLLAIGSLTGVACDREDQADFREGANQVKKGAEEAGKQVENTVDNEIDTDGQDN